MMVYNVDIHLVTPDVIECTTIGSNHRRGSGRVRALVRRESMSLVWCSHRRLDFRVKRPTKSARRLPLPSIMISFSRWRIVYIMTMMRVAPIKCMNTTATKATEDQKDHCDPAKCETTNNNARDHEWFWPGCGCGRGRGRDRWFVRCCCRARVFLCWGGFLALYRRVPFRR